MADLGAGPHNLARFSRFGRFLALAGFGNLPGDLVIHERKGDAKWKQLAATRWVPFIMFGIRFCGDTQSICAMLRIAFYMSISLQSLTFTTIKSWSHDDPQGEQRRQHGVGS